MNNKIFSHGILSKMPTEITEGQIKLATDTHGLYFDIDGKRIRITDFETVDSLDKLDDILAPIENMYYYVKDENTIYKYTSNGWKPLFYKHFEDDGIHVTKEKQDKWDKMASTEIVDNCDSEDATKILSANQGRDLKEKINSLIWSGTHEEFETAKSNGSLVGVKIVIFTDDESDTIVEHQITESSMNPVSSQAIYNALEDKVDKSSIITNELTEASTNDQVPSAALVYSLITELQTQIADLVTEYTKS